ncbi:MAG: M20 metallopeptidase family protein [Eubacterium sp.]|jgi:amidohydrolase
MALLDDFVTKEELAETERRVIAHRRAFHEHPELGLKEFETSKYIKSVLNGLGIENKAMAGTGVLGLIRGTAPAADDGPVIVLRADMDALPIEEKTGKPYASKCGGVMHACGHDGHMAVLLGCAEVLNAHRDKLRGTVKLFFQPAEESDGGAAIMIKEGALENPRADYALGMHMAPDFPAGTLAVKYGESYAASDPFDIVIKGKGAHGAHPEKGIDAILIAAKVLDAIQLVVSRMSSPQKAIVVTVGRIEGGNIRNQIADRAEMQGIIRTLDNDFRREAREMVRTVAERTASVYGGSAEVDIRISYPALQNDDNVVALVERSARDVLGDDHVEVEKYAEMCAEDFAYIAAEVPSCFMHLGCRSEKEGDAPELHSAYFDMDESCLIAGVKVQINNVLTLIDNFKRTGRNGR